MTRRHKGITRRNFLRGVGGVVLALPFLESITWPGDALADDHRPIYSVFVRQGNGVAQQTRDEPERFWPAATGPITRQSLEAEPGKAVSELAPWADRLLMVRGVNYGFGSGDCGHSAGMAQCLTAANHTAGRANETQALGPSVDVRIASELTPDTPGLNLVAARITNAYIGANLSYSLTGQRRSAEANPWNVFLDLFAGGANPQVLDRLAVQRKSVNDLVREEMAALMARDMSRGDRDRLNQHFESIYDLQTTMACNGLSEMAIAELQGFDPQGQGRDPEGQDVRDLIVDLQMQVIAAAFACDLVRTAVLQIGTGNDQTVYTVDGQTLPFNFHWISHRIQSDGSEGDPIPNADVLHHQIDRKFARYFRRLIELLDARTTVAGRNLLDDTVAVWTNDLSKGVSHGRDNLPFVIAGSGGGYLRQGQYVDAGGVTNNRLFNTVLNAVGCTKDGEAPVDDFGDPSLTGGEIEVMKA